MYASRSPVHIPLRTTRLWPSGLNGSGNTSAALPRVHAGNRSPSVESPNQELSSLLKIFPLKKNDDGVTVVLVKLPWLRSEDVRQVRCPEACACRSCPSGCGGSRPQIGTPSG